MTIGYEGAVLCAFIETLLAAKVLRLIDVRELPLSRKRGFSKNALSLALESAGIEYLHLRALGDPKAGREAARRGDRASFVHIFNQHLESPKAVAALEVASMYVTDVSSCLMCYEREYTDCHRSIVADALAKRNKMAIQHLTVPPMQATFAMDDQQYAHAALG
ncbi:MAG TPA: DUF488 domain-containing protein [Caulobacteraceae bacterium]